MRMLLLYLVLGIACEVGCAADEWGEFRGPRGDGIAASSQPPVTWSEEKHIQWKTEIHDKGWSSPVVWENQIWITTATEDGHQLFAVCVDRTTGDILHDRLIFEVENPEPVPFDNSYASPTSAIEAGRVYLHYGTYGTACVDTNSGEILWERRDLKCEHEAGPNSSPFLWNDLLIVNVDGRDVQYVIALDKFSGDTVWKTERSVDFSEVPVHQRKAYSMPLLIDTDGPDNDGGLQIVSPGGRSIISYDPADGTELWKIEHRGWSIAPRPVYGHDLLFAVMDHDHPELWAIRPDGTGDVTETHIEWKLKRGVPARSSPILIDDLLFMVDRNGVLSCVEAVTGDIVWKERLEGNYSASPIFADGRLYFFNEDAVTTIIKPGRKFELVSENALAKDVLMATPAAVGDELIIRTLHHLYCISEPPAE
ncbi:MAG: hypothetical protein CMJ46_00725 [Planctomyces sp.]|nr:hypothetical protein [Planctomyces sp.]